jgi:hypothetical protein
MYFDIVFSKLILTKVAQRHSYVNILNSGYAGDIDS